MILSAERVILAVIGIALVLTTLSSLTPQMREIEGKRDENCLNTALRSVDLAITNAIGGGVAEGYVFLPVKVSYECSGGTVRLSAGNKSASLSYPFRLICGGEAYLAGKFHASWRRDARGEAELILSWSGVRG
ncbi:MAG: hypothetical protein QW418_02265 [Candidatus Korarchaeum sp.]